MNGCFAGSSRFENRLDAHKFVATMITKTSTICKRALNSRCVRVLLISGACVRDQKRRCAEKGHNGAVENEVTTVDDAACQIIKMGPNDKN